MLGSIDAETDAHLWAERFERDTRDLFALQDEITSRIAIALGLDLTIAEAARPTSIPMRWNTFFGRALRLLAVTSKKPTLYLERALALDPHSAEAQSDLAWALAGRVLRNMSGSPAADLERAKALSEGSLGRLAAQRACAYRQGRGARAQHQYAEAIPEYETVLALDRNFVYAFYALGQCKLFTGSIEETIPLIERAIPSARAIPDDGSGITRSG